MQTQLAPEYQNRPEGQDAKAILGKCVHCGFCTATCPTYQLLGDELDGPRGRIYLIKQVLEGEAPTRKTQQHLDRCLTCRNCESTCPSGVDYGHLIDIGRKIVEEKVPRPATERGVRWLLKEGLNSSAFAPAMKMGQMVRGLLPAKLKAKVPASQNAGAWPTTSHQRKVLMLEGCVQPAMMPNINTATARVLHAAQIEVVRVQQAQCCGAVKLHLNDESGALAQARANIDAWWPHIERGTVEAIVMNASGCGATVKEYGHLFKRDAAYAAKAQRVSELCKDLSELLPVVAEALQAKGFSAAQLSAEKRSLVFHPPCTLQHGQKLRGGVEKHLQALGFEVRLAERDSHLCCGSAGTYSVLQPTLATALRDNKLAALSAKSGQTIISANIGCITHLQSGTDTPVRHWVEVLDQALA
jgi:glycolate oxidase iron-sulfur subunit